MVSGTTQQGNTVSSGQMGRVIFASTVGTAIEWYDFFLFGTMASLVFPKLFFPTADATVSTLLSLFTFLAGFIARPIGGLIFGHLGDRIGRKTTLVATLLLMGIGTLLIGFLPTYSSIGIAAPLLLLFLRLFQGLGIGGEWGGSVLLAMEYGHKKNRGFWVSWPQMGAPIGLVVSSFVVNVVQSNTGANFVQWGWRIPFYFSALLIVVGLFIRLGILETPLFAQLKSQQKQVSAPIIDAFRHSTPEILLSAGSRFVENAPFYIFATFVVIYGKTLKLEPSLLLNAVTIGALIEVITIPIFAALSDRIGRRIWYLVGCALMASFAYPYFLLFNTKDPLLVTVAIAASLAIFHGWVYGPQAAMIAERFGTRSRYSGASMGYQLAAPFAGGLAPIIALLLLSGKTNLAALGLKSVTLGIGSGSWQNVAAYLVVLSVLGFLATLGLRELTKSDISQAATSKEILSEVPVANVPQE